MSIKGVYNNKRNVYVINNEPMILHCHHYNCFLQKSIESASDYIDTVSILQNTAHEVTYSLFSNLFKSSKTSATERVSIVENVHKFCGFGTLNLSSLTEDGGMAHSPSNHYVEGWISKFGLRKTDELGVAYFTSGFIAGALSAIYNKNAGYFGAKQILCKSKGEENNTFKIGIENIKNLMVSPKEGEYQVFDFQNSPDSPIDYIGIREALTGMAIEGDNNGIISSFGVMLTRMFANYYTLISFKYLNQMEEEMGDMGRQIAEELLIESGHVCAFNTFGGIMISPEWEGLILPMIESKKDWVHGIVACLNALGWGGIRVKELIPEEKIVIEILSGYENNSYLKAFGLTDKATSLFKIGATAGIMNLIYHADITTKPELNDEYYNETFKAKGRFVGKQIQCRGEGAKSDIFEATRN